MTEIKSESVSTAVLNWAVENSDPQALIIALMCVVILAFILLFAMLAASFRNDRLEGQIRIIKDSLTVTNNDSKILRGDVAREQKLNQENESLIAKLTEANDSLKTFHERCRLKLLECNESLNWYQHLYHVTYERLQGAIRVHKTEMRIVKGKAQTKRDQLESQVSILKREMETKSRMTSDAIRRVTEVETELETCKNASAIAQRLERQLEEKDGLLTKVVKELEELNNENLELREQGMSDAMQKMLSTFRDFVPVLHEMINEGMTIKLEGRPQHYELLMCIDDWLVAGGIVKLHHEHPEVSDMEWISSKSVGSEECISELEKRLNILMPQGEEIEGENSTESLHQASAGIIEDWLKSGNKILYELGDDQECSDDIRRVPYHPNYSIPKEVSDQLREVKKQPIAGSQKPATITVVTKTTDEISLMPVCKDGSPAPAHVMEYLSQNGIQLIEATKSANQEVLNAIERWMMAGRPIGFNNVTHYVDYKLGQELPGLVRNFLEQEDSRQENQS